MPKREAVDIDALIDPDLAVILDGKEVPVMPIDGAAYQLLSGLESSPSVETMYRVAARCLPSLPEERIMRLTPAQVGAVVKLASESIEKVEALASPNSAPAGKGRSNGKHRFQRA